MSNPDYRTTHFVESIATLMEQEGFPRMTGRVMGMMMICDPPHQSSAELADALNASRGAISTATRALLQTGLIHRRPMPGSRATFFEMKPNAIDQLLHGQLVRLRLFKQVITDGLKILEPQPVEIQTRLREFLEVLDFMEAEFPKLIARWDAQHKESQ